ncbi:hypothetical protein IQ268_23970 [Oculatella sp. LEGE 06141]|uniref:hypothetical protein n=1 Tax=Oculatella sp. LEGE 06141 TaxID=1828648 RepID=UPI001880C6AA|nr:hypothetical protein [Oculatella sp. LEGE 06141]MBE9181625.1 hypothetical protein [Oculatella sp. LEGE 06141]
MASIKLTDLHPVGSALFQDSENFLNELTEHELGVLGGGRNIFISIGEIKASIYAFTLISANSNTINANSISAINTLVLR